MATGQGILDKASAEEGEDAEEAMKLAEKSVEGEMLAIPVERELCCNICS